MKACREVSSFRPNADLARPVGLQTPSGPLVFVQHALCSLVVAAALLLPGPALAEELRNVPSAIDTLRDLPSRNPTVERRIREGSGLDAPSLDGVKQRELRLSGGPVGASAPALLVLTHQSSWGVNTLVPLQSSRKENLDHQASITLSIFGGQQPAGRPLQSLEFQTALGSSPLGLTKSFAVISNFSVQSLGSPSSTAASRFSQLGSLGSVAGPVHMVSQRPRSSRLVNPVFQEHPRALHRRSRQRKVAVAALPAANQALNQGVSQALSDEGLNQFAELAVGAAKKAFNPGVLGATAGASLKLFTVCGKSGFVKLCPGITTLLRCPTTLTLSNIMREFDVSLPPVM